MKRMLVVCAVLLLAAAWSWAGGAMIPNGAALWKDITVTSPYTKWGQWPDHMGLQKGASPHGPLHVVYVNEAGLHRGYPKPVGTVVVKENYTPEKKLAAITVMYKVAGYNPAAGDWFWVKYSPDGMVLKEGKPAGCVGCHSSRAKNDYIMVSDY